MERRRLLAIDGGGIRGVVALETIVEIEAVLRRETGDPDLRLGDWFDYIAGTSTGAIIAAALALGRSAHEVLDLYQSQARRIFHRANGLARLRHRYDHRGLTALLQRELGTDTLLGSPRLRCLLMVGVRNATTDSPWPVSSNPRAAFNDPALASSNLRIPLWQLVRASTAAPTYFPAERITLDGVSFEFTDGGTTPLNNPAFQLFLMATMPEYRLGWATGPDRLLLVSVGTGSSPVTVAPGTPERMLWDHANEVPLSLMHSIAVQQDLACRSLSTVRHGLDLDEEVGAVEGLPVHAAPLFTYTRYDAEAPTPLSTIDAVGAVPELRAWGRRIASGVDASHFAGFV
ncbi:patatin-like phospholipase family protein [Demequina mangrovi]|uniref:Patatin-like phospholipase n=1 Tax=Demequina mangrovi TaxID=1043493 RepID=A0A1H6X9I7_9MICO|nr:patatin-like phospholipase family protein [Demequina mangrovi]SEJ25809.1 Patatin-like phospholipase [Demequina mangrovi]